MDKKLKRRWIRALRHGKNYRQAKHYLRIKNDGRVKQMCCVGVLCDLVDPKGWTRDDFLKDVYKFEGSGKSRVQYPWDNVMASYAFAVDNGIPHPQLVRLGMMNDDGRSWDEIADWIEDNVEEAGEVA